QTYPHVDVSFNIANRVSVLQRFQNQLDDLYLFSNPPTGDSVVRRRFLINSLVLIAPLLNLSTMNKNLKFSELVNDRFLMREPGSATSMVFETWLREKNYQLQNTLQIESNEVIRMSVETGLGLAVLSEHTLAQTNPKVAILPVKDFPLTSHWYLV